METKRQIDGFSPWPLVHEPLRVECQTLSLRHAGVQRRRPQRGSQGIFDMVAVPGGASGRTCPIDEVDHDDLEVCESTQVADEEVQARAVAMIAGVQREMHKECAPDDGGIFNGAYHLAEAFAVSLRCRW